MKLCVNLAAEIGEVSHAATGSLYGVTEENPGDWALSEIRPKVLVNPTEAGPGRQQRVGAAVPVARRVRETGGLVQIRFADLFTGWYDYEGFEDWSARINRSMRDVMDAGLDTIYGFEIWNEPDFSWKGQYVMPLEEDVYHYVTFSIVVPREGEYDVTVRYANGSGKTALQELRVNGEKLREVAFPSTGSWFRAGGSGDVHFSAKLCAGANRITLAKGAAGSVELDYMEVAGAAPSRYEAEDSIRGGYAPMNSGHTSSRQGEHRTFNEFYRLTQQLVKNLDPSARTIGPSFAVYTHAGMYEFLRYQKAHGTLPDCICWHQLADEDFTAAYEDYRKLEKSLGVGPLPVTINEYSGGGWFEEEGMPGVCAPLIAKFERFRIHSACLSYWNSPGKLGSLLTTRMEPNGGYWFYKWYADMEGRMVEVTPPSPHDVRALDGFACLRSGGSRAELLFGGETEGGCAELRIENVPDSIGPRVHIRLEHVPFEHRTVMVKGPETVLEKELQAENGSLSIGLQGLEPRGGYRLTVIKAGEETEG